ncbi:MAG: copper amine oxidase N-terminal domain-containing protein [Clostridia bacterium]|nr:copper amine oxidase N-terminal domain-containing protein [Clostridia bacterium]
MKKALVCTLIFLLLLSVGVLAEEATQDTSFRVVFDGQEITFPDQQTYIYNDRYLYVPIRPISEALGYEVSWDGDTQTATIQKGDRTATFTIGGKCYVNGEEKAAMVNFPLINGRTFVSQYGLCHALDCTMSWNDVERVLYLYSNEKFENGVPFTQGTHVGANLKDEEYEEFYSMAEPAFIYPGLNEHITPQGIAYRKDTDQFYLSGYFSAKIKNLNSTIIVVDAKTGKQVGQYQLLKADGSPHRGHVGGLAVSDKDIYLESGKNIQRISLAAVDALGSTGYLKVEDEITLTLGIDSSNDFVECSDGYLWLGNYFCEDDKKYSKTIVHESYPFLIRGYKLDPTEDSGLAAEYKVENNEWYEYIPEVLYEVEEQKIQGMTSIGNYLVTATSQSWNPSYLHIYDTSKPAGTNGAVILGDGKEIPVIRLNLEKSIKATPYMEEITHVDGNLYVTFESGAVKYRRKANKYTTDTVWKIAVDKLTAPAEKELP